MPELVNKGLRYDSAVRYNIVWNVSCTTMYDRTNCVLLKAHAEVNPDVTFTRVIDNGEGAELEEGLETAADTCLGRCHTSFRLNVHSTGSKLLTQRILEVKFTTADCNCVRTSRIAWAFTGLLTSDTLKCRGFLASLGSAERACAIYDHVIMTYSYIRIQYTTVQYRLDCEQCMGF